MAVALTLKFIIEAIACFVLPPVGVLIHTGCTADVIINILLTLLGWIPGVIHGFYVILTKPATL